MSTPVFSQKTLSCRVQHLSSLVLTLFSICLSPISPPAPPPASNWLFSTILCTMSTLRALSMQALSPIANACQNNCPVNYMFKSWHPKDKVVSKLCLFCAPVVTSFQIHVHTLKHTSNGAMETQWSQKKMEPKNAQ